MHCAPTTTSASAHRFARRVVLLVLPRTSRHLDGRCKRSATVRACWRRWRGRAASMQLLPDGVADVVCGVLRVMCDVLHVAGNGRWRVLDSSRSLHQPQLRIPLPPLPRLLDGLRVPLWMLRVVQPCGCGPVDVALWMCPCAVVKTRLCLTVSMPSMSCDKNRQVAHARRLFQGVQAGRQAGG